MTTNAEVAAYLRVSSLAIALFDFLQTIPGEYRLYSQQTSITRLSPACILFVLIRYISVAALVTSNVGFFGTHFTPSSCRSFFLVAPVLKLMATLVSQIIISIRTYAVARKARWVFWGFIVLFVLCLVPEIVANTVRRVMSQNAHSGYLMGIPIVPRSCTSGNLSGAKLAWLHYLAAMIYDAVAMGIASYYLYSASHGLNMMSSLTRMMLEEGILFFLALTSFNILNVILFQNDNLAIQSSATTLGQAITMIFSQKFILNLSDNVFERQSRSRSSRQQNEPRSISRGFARAQFVRTFTQRSLNGIDTKGDTVELGIRVEKDVEITMDDLKPYSPTRSSPAQSQSESGHTQKSPTGMTTKGAASTLTWEAQ